MADLSDLQSGITVKVVGAGSTGSENNYTTVTSNQEIAVFDSGNTSGTSGTLSLTTTAVEIKVGGSRLTNRKYIYMEALSNNVKWGFTTTCEFDLFKNQFFVLPIGNITVYMKVSTGTGSSAIAEVA